MNDQLQNSNLPTIDFSGTDQLVADLKDKYKDLPVVESEKTRKVVTSAIGDFKKLRTSIEAKRKELKSESLEWQRTLDSAAKEATSVVSEFEQELIALRQPYDDAKVEQERLKVIEFQRLEDERTQKIKLEEEKQVAERLKLEAERQAFEAEKQKLEEEKNRAEFEKKALEQARINAEKEREAQERFAQEERARLEKERVDKEVSDKLAEIARVKKEESIRVQAEEERIEKINQDHAKELARIESERLAKEKAEQEEKERLEEIRAEEARQKLLMPEKEKLLAFADALESLDIPRLDNDGLNAILIKSVSMVKEASNYIRKEV